MAASCIVVMTGVTSGMGLEVAKKLLAQPDVELIAGARSPTTSKLLKALNRNGKLTVLPLDLADMESVVGFADAVCSKLGPDRKIDKLVCNAGLQIITPKRMTTDGVEETFATNHLGHFLLTQKLIPQLADGGLVVSTASGTHDPDEPLATRFGFIGAVFKNARAVSLGDVGEERGVEEQGIDRYATSKLCNILFIRDMAKRIPPAQVRFLAFDPGMMPGTALARERPAVVQFIVKYIIPLFRPFVRSMSSVGKSSDAMVELIMATRPKFQSGDYVEFTGGPAPESEVARDSSKGEDLYQVSMSLTSKYLG